MKTRPTDLIADDHAGVRGFVSGLRAEDFEIVETVDDGGRLYGRQRNQKPEVVVMDIAMPLRDGFQAARDIRSRGVVSKIDYRE